MKRMHTRALSLLMALVLLLGMIPAVSIPASAAIVGSEIATGSGAGDRWLKADTYYDTVAPLEGIPLTLEVVVKRPSGGTRQDSYMALFGSYVDDSTPSISFGISGRRPIVTVIHEDGTKVSKKMTTYAADNTCGKTTSDKIGVYSTKYMHLAYVLDPINDKVGMYVDGQLAGTYSLSLGELPANQIFRLGGDLREGNSAYFDGAIHLAAVYSTPRTAEQIAADYTSLNTSHVLDYEDETLIAAWDLSKQGENGCRDRSGNGYALSFHAGVGMRFDTYGPHKLPENLSAMPETVEAWIYLPSCYSRRGGTILGTYNGDGTEGSYFGFEINYNGVPRFFYTDAITGISYDYKFSEVDLNADAWAHIAWVHDVEGGAMRFYVNGTEAQAITTGIADYPTDFLDTYCHVGGDKQKNGMSQRFNAFIKELRVYSDVRTGEEIAADCAGNFDYTDESFILHYEMEPEDRYKDLVDLTGKGNTAVYEQSWWDEVDPPPADYAYSFAIVGDTQRLACKTPTALTKLYGWIADNVEEKKIQYVLGLGDITENNSDTEWTDARNAIKQIDGKVPYSLIWGAYHDSAEKFNEYFGTSATEIDYTQHVDGYMTEGDISNTYHEFTVGAQPYLILCLETGAQDHILEWAADVIKAHPQHRVIITTHAYLQADGTFLEAGESSCATSYDKNNNNGDQLWEKLFSKHPNIYMVLCGHMSTEEVMVRKSMGDYGNEVTEMLINPQGMDVTSATGMVAMLYFSEDGKDVHVEYYSTAQDKWKPNKTIAMPGNATETYGTIPSEYSDVNSYPLVAFVDGECVGAAATWQAALTLARTTLATDGNNGKTITLLLRDDVTVTANPATADHLTNMNGTVVFDLGGHTVEADKLLFRGNVNTDYNGNFDTNVILKNGTLVIDASYLFYSSHSQQAGEDKVLNLIFEDVTIRRTAAATTGQTFYAKNTSATAKTNYFNFVFNDCTFDFSESEIKCCLFNFDDADICGSIEINGGSIKAPNKAVKLTLSTGKAGSSFVFGRGSDGAYPALTLPAGVAVTDRLNTNSFTTVSGCEAQFGGDGVASNDCVTYSLVVSGEISTAYGMIPNDYEDATAHPFVAFINGECVGSAKTWAAANTLVRETLDANNGATVNVLLRDDATISSAHASSDYLYLMNGTAVFDLGGHTLTVNKRMFVGNVYASYTGDYASGVVVKNGTVLMNTAYPFLSQNKQTQGVNKVFSLTFENVILKRTAALESNQTFYAGNSDAPTKHNHFNFIFNDCTFDYADSAVSCRLFDFNKVKVTATIRVNGGSIIAPTNAYKLTVANLRSSGSSFAFGKGSDGAYPTLTLPADVAVTDRLNTNSFVTVDGDKVAFVKDGDVYKLAYTEPKIMGAYLNIANDINVTYAVSVPAGYESPYMVFEFGGKSYTVTDFSTGADGTLAFTFTGIAPHLAGDNIKATLYATKDGVEASVEKAEYSVLTYCKNMLNKTDDETLKTLLSDLLVYAAASQTYADYKADALVTEGLELTPSTFSPLASTDKALLGESDARVSWKGVALRYENAMAMKLGFVADETLTLRVSVNGRVTEYASSAWGRDADGNAVVYFRGILATEYGDVVTAAFYDGEEQVGQSVTYSVNSYVYSMQDAESALGDLVRATYNYGASAEIYAGK